jgi:hypothetical protein
MATHRRGRLWPLLAVGGLSVPTVAAAQDLEARGY